MATTSLLLESTDQQLPEEQIRSPTQTRSYECTFCKRGFSNAQALGGHMNIHRKDRAKKLTLDITKKNLSFPLMTNRFDFEDKTFPWFFPKDIDGIAGSGDICVKEELRQLDLFVESPSSSEGRKLNYHPTDNKERETDVDLELRLGTKPFHRTTTGTIHFF